MKILKHTDLTELRKQKVESVEDKLTAAEEKIAKLQAELDALKK